ncbi:hypothetical protein Tco_0349710 [Tanacetum coccineum]
MSNGHPFMPEEPICLHNGFLSGSLPSPDYLTCPGGGRMSDLEEGAVGGDDEDHEEDIQLNYPAIGHDDDGGGGGEPYELKPMMWKRMRTRRG